LLAKLPKALILGKDETQSEASQKATNSLGAKKRGQAMTRKKKPWAKLTVSLIEREGKI